MGWSPNLFAPLCSVGNTLILNSPTTSMRKSYISKALLKPDPFAKLNGKINKLVGLWKMQFLPSGLFHHSISKAMPCRK